jgi:hypothetical protein
VAAGFNAAMVDDGHAGGKAPRLRRRWPWVLGAVVAAIVLVRLLADPLAVLATRRALARVDGFRGTVAHVHIGFFPPVTVVEGLKLAERDAPAGRTPTLFVRHAVSRVDVSRLLRGAVVIDQKIADTKLVLPVGGERELIDRTEAALRALPRLLAPLPRARIARMSIEHGEALIAIEGQPGRPRFWLHAMDVVAKNLVTEPRRGDVPMTASFHGKAQRTGEVAAALTLPLPQSPRAPSLELRFALEGLAARELYSFLKPRTGVEAPTGTVSIYSHIEVDRGAISGWMRPVLTNVEVTAAEDDLGDRVKAWLVDKSVELFEANENNEEKGDKTIVPIRGHFDPDRSAFANLMAVAQRSLKATFAGLVPGKPDEGDGAGRDRAVQARRKGAQRPAR